jgi:predicted secreted hydrolase
MHRASRRSLLLAALGSCCGLLPARAATQGRYGTASPGYKMQFPRDHGSHPEFRIEWWYVTGWLQDQAAHELGFQITFFRARPQLSSGNPSAFTPEQVIIAHAAIADPLQRRLVHTQKAARATFALAGAAQDNTRVWLDDWQLIRSGNSYEASITAPELGLAMQFTQAQPLILQGTNGYSRKGAGADAASHYYSVPHLQVSGSLRSSGATRAVTGKAWLDHEWSSAYMPESAEGWDWIGINLDDGGALMAFRMRGHNTLQPLWAAATMRDGSGRTRTFKADAIRFTALRQWRSPRTGTQYPVAFRVNIGSLEIVLEPLMDDQENDTRQTTGAVYWEGAVRASARGQHIGKGYLELTGYGQPLKL